MTKSNHGKQGSEHTNPNKNLNRPPNLETEDLITSQESENLDLAEKGLHTPLNPTNDGMKADSKDVKTVLENANQDSAGIINQTEKPSSKKSEAV